MRISSVFTLLCSIAALVLSLLVLFAGSSRSFLQSGDLLTVRLQPSPALGLYSRGV